MNSRSRALPFTVVCAAFAVMTFAGCGISSETLASAERTNGQIDQGKNAIERSRQELAAFHASEDSAGLRNAVEREQWDAHCAAALEKVSQARRLYDEEIQPIVDVDDYAREYRVRELIEMIQPILKAAREEADFWRVRSQALLAARTNADSIHGTARAGVAEIQVHLSQLESRAAAAKREFAEQSGAVDQLIAPLGGLAQGSRDALAKLEREYQAHASGSDADYGILATEAERIGENLSKSVRGAAAAEAKFAELSQSYSKTLIDMKAEYSLLVRRQSWDESADNPSLHDFNYPPSAVDGQTFDRIDRVSGSLATFTKGWFGDDFRLLSGVDQTLWDGLGIDVEESWAVGDNSAEYWVQDAIAKYFHKYHVVENGDESETDWVEVDEAFFFANLDNLGMDVEAKPYGVFEENKLTHAAPPGMAYVGNERYGRWERSGGGSVWTWIAPYLFYRSMFGSPWMYSRNEYNTWRGGYYGSRPYYGGTASAPTYGTRSSRTQTSPRLSGSTFGRSGGFSRPAGSVRGAGPASRGGGFGGSGK